MVKGFLFYEITLLFVTWIAKAYVYQMFLLAIKTKQRNIFQFFSGQQQKIQNKASLALNQISNIISIKLTFKKNKDRYARTHLNKSYRGIQWYLLYVKPTQRITTLLRLKKYTKTRFGIVFALVTCFCCIHVNELKCN